MTNQEAITKLTNIMHDDHYAWHPSILAAFDMAVDALKGADGDSISKQVLKETFVETSLLEWEQLKKCYPMLEVVDELPSAQPELGKNSPSEQHKMDKLGVKTEETCTDTISRVEAIDVLDEIESEVADGYGYQYEKWRKYFCELPSAQPEPSIPLSWIEKEIEWLKSLDDGFSTLTAMQISAMVKKWKEAET